MGDILAESRPLREARSTAEQRHSKEVDEEIFSMRERFKCPNCGLIQWKEDACKRCGAPCDEAAPDWDDLPPIEDLPTLDVDAAEPVRRFFPAKHKTLIAVGAVGFVIVFFMFLSPSSTREYFPQQVSFEALDILCPFDSGSFICQHVQSSDGWVKTVKSASNRDKFTSMVSGDRFRVRSRTTGLGLYLEGRTYDNEMAYYLYNGGSDIPLIDEKTGMERSLRVDFGDSDCLPIKIRIYRVAFVGADTLHEFFSDVIMSCENGQIAVGRVCINCGSVRERTQRDKRYALKRSRMSYPRISIRDLDKFCKTKSTVSICYVTQEGAAKSNDAVYEEANHVIFSGDAETGFSVLGPRLVIRLEPGFGGTLKGGAYVIGKGESPRFSLKAPECMKAKPKQFAFDLYGGQLRTITFEAACENDRLIIGYAFYRPEVL